MENIQTNKINTRSLSAIFSICTLVCSFVAFILGTIEARGMIAISSESQTIQLEWAICAPYLVFMILAFLCAAAKFFVCTCPFRKEYPSKDTIKVQFAMEIIALVVLIFGCVSLAFVKFEQDITAILAVPMKWIIGPIITSTLSFAMVAGCAGLTYHNYR